MRGPLHIIDHPLVQHKLTLLRAQGTPGVSFRQLTSEIGAMLAYEITRDAQTEAATVETPRGTATGRRLTGKKVVLLGILRAGLGVLDGMLSVIPAAKVGHIGLYRDPRLRTAVEYYLKLPSDMPQRDVIVVASVLATGNTAAAAVRRVQEAGARSVRFACLLASRSGIEAFQQTHPEVPVYTAGVDEGMDDEGYIVPGLGDVGDRLYGTE